MISSKGLNEVEIIHNNGTIIVIPNRVRRVYEIVLVQKSLRNEAKGRLCLRPTKADCFTVVMVGLSSIYTTRCDSELYNGNRQNNDEQNNG